MRADLSALVLEREKEMEKEKEKEKEKLKGEFRETNFVWNIHATEFVPVGPPPGTWEALNFVWNIHATEFVPVGPAPGVWEVLAPKEIPEPNDKKPHDRLDESVTVDPEAENQWTIH